MEFVEENEMEGLFRIVVRVVVEKIIFIKILFEKYYLI